MFSDFAGADDNIIVTDIFLGCLQPHLCESFTPNILDHPNICNATIAETYNIVVLRIVIGDE